MKETSSVVMLAKIVKNFCELGEKAKCSHLYAVDGWHYDCAHFISKDNNVISIGEVRAALSALRLLVNNAPSEYFGECAGKLYSTRPMDERFKKAGGIIWAILDDSESDCAKILRQAATLEAERKAKECLSASVAGLLNPMGAKDEQEKALKTTWTISTPTGFTVHSDTGSITIGTDAFKGFIGKAPSPDKPFPSKGLVFSRSECEADFIERFADSLTAVANNVCDDADKINLASSNIGASMVGLRHIQQICHAQQLRNGWWEKDANGRLVDRNHGEVLALITSEISEALEGDRKDLEDPHVAGRKNVEVELADAVCRIFDAAHAWGFDIAGALTDKLAYNARRADHKVGNRKKEGGKKY